MSLGRGQALHLVFPRVRVAVLVPAPEAVEVVVHLGLGTVVVKRLAQPAVVEDLRVEVAVLVGHAVLGSPRVELHVLLLVAPEEPVGARTRWLVTLEETDSLKTEKGHT